VPDTVPNRFFISFAPLLLLQSVSVLLRIFLEHLRAARPESRAFATEVRARGDALQNDWLNNGPASLANHLLPQPQERLQALFRVMSFVSAALSRGSPLRQTVRLMRSGYRFRRLYSAAPTTDELAKVLSWLELQDANPDWPAHVRATLVDLRRRLGHGI
jgi:hypothetical protein